MPSLGTELSTAHSAAISSVHNYLNNYLNILHIMHGLVHLTGASLTRCAVHLFLLLWKSASSQLRPLQLAQSPAFLRSTQNRKVIQKMKREGSLASNK